MKNKTFYSPDLLNEWISGSTFDLYSNCNSKFRELRRANERNDKVSIVFWTKRIELISKVKNELFKWFYLKETKIKTEIDFKCFIEVFKRYIQIKTKISWYNLCTGATN